MTQDPGDMAGASQSSLPHPFNQPEVKELRPILWDEDMKKDMMDMRPLPVPSGEEDEEAYLNEISDPKGFSAAEPAESSDVEPIPELPSSEIPAKIVVPTVGKGSMPARV